MKAHMRMDAARFDSVLGLPDSITACLFDLDGVLTPTAVVHDQAWTTMFNVFLRAHSARTGEAYRPFDPDGDYNSYVDGRPRADGVRTFLASRGITLPDGSPDDGPDHETVNGLANRKNQALLAVLREQGVTPYPGSVSYLRAVAAAGLRRAVVSASANCGEVVRAAGLSDLLEVMVDGKVAARDHLAGKPAPDTFLAAARDLGARPDQAAVFEDALAGVEAGRAGGFGCVVGVDRVHHADDLRAHGASLVVSDLSELLNGSAG
jgi:beta-phosphoglucomutase family hydrolase